MQCKHRAIADNPQGGKDKEYCIWHDQFLSCTTCYKCPDDTTISNEDKEWAKELDAAFNNKLIKI